jgi:hypothetical protein
MFSEVIQSDSTSFTLTWLDDEVDGCRSVALAEDVYRITIESSGGGLVSETSFVFTERTSSNRSYTGIASSSDGVKLVAVVRGGFIYTSSDSGATWIQRTSGVAHSWRDVASSSDGVKLVAVDSGDMEDGKIWTSIDSGENWTEQDSGSGPWEDVASSSDGVKLVA